MTEQFEKIELNDYVQTGEGGTALTYNHKNGKTLAKLFMQSYAADSAIREFHINEIVYQSGLPTPQPIRLITDGTRLGTEYELISPKRSFTRIISQEPDQLEPLSKRFALLARQIHEKPADTERLPNMNELVLSWTDRFEELPQELKKRIHRFIETLPAKPNCLHGDLHIGNIITDGQRDLWIDVGDFAYGVPQWDLGMLYYSTHFLSSERCDNIFHLDSATLKAHWDAFAPIYYNTDSQEALDAEVRKLQPFIAAKMTFIISKLRNGKGPVSEALQNVLNKFLSQQ